MAIRKIYRLWYYYYRDKDKKEVVIPLGTPDREEAEKRAFVIDEQRKGARLLAKSQKAYEDSYIRALPKNSLAGLAAMGNQQQMQGLQQLMQMQNAQFSALMQVGMLNNASCPTEKQPQDFQFGGSVSLPSQMRQPVIDDKNVRTTFDEMLMAAQRYKKTIGKNHALAWKSFKEWCTIRGIEYVQDVTPRLAQLYMNDSYGEAKSGTYNEVRTCLNVVFKTGLIDAGMSASPFSLVVQRPVDDATHFRDFTLDECRKIIDNACPYWKVLCMISLYTGLREETCRRLSPSHIKDDCIKIMPGKTARFGRKVFIPLLPELKDFLGAITPFDENDEMPYCEHYEIKRNWSLSLNQPGDKRRHRYFAGLMKHLGIQDENGEKADFPSFRCTFITMLSKNGIRKEVIKGIAGHASDEMTELYNHDTESAKSILEIPKLGIGSGL